MLDTHTTVPTKPSEEELFNRINPLARSVMSPRRDYFSRGHHFRGDWHLNGSQLNCHKGSGTGKFSYLSTSAPWRYHYSWRSPFNWGHICIVSQLNSHQGSGTGKFSYSSAVLFCAAPANLAIPVQCYSGNFCRCHTRCPQ